MRKHLLNGSVLVAVAALCLGVMLKSTTAGSFTRGCAARDLQILMLIEERESTNAILAERLSDAMFMMMDARMICPKVRFEQPHASVLGNEVLLDMSFVERFRRRQFRTVLSVRVCDDQCRRTMTWDGDLSERNR